MPALISVLVVDDHPVIRLGLARLLASTDDILVLGTASTGEAAVAMASELRPDVVLMDIALPDLDGIEATRLIKAATPATAVVMLTTYDDREQVEHAIDAGASGFISKRIAPEALLECVRAAPYDWVSFVPSATSGPHTRPVVSPLAPLGLQRSPRHRAGPGELPA